MHAVRWREVPVFSPTFRIKSSAVDTPTHKAGAVERRLKADVFATLWLVLPVNR